ncbi:MAG: UDP-glucose 4-epimerase GalE [Anaerolineae bacterium]|nr:UDP-glucose 4-epimerase GalE [Anaerolineae bacterium]
MRVLVTGGAGYIGSHVSAELIRQGDDVIVYDNLYQGHAAAVDPQAIFVQGDLADRAALRAVFETHDIDAVMHFASYTLVGESWEKPFLYLRDNVVNGLNLMETAVKYGVKRFVLSSTANLFDNPERMPIDETERIVPGSPYGESKNLLERLLLWMDRVYGMKYAALRYFNACGCVPPLGEDHAPETHLIPIILQVALGQRDHLVIFGDDYPTPDGTCIRDYIHVRDLASAHILALRALDQGSRTYNLGTGNGYSIREILDVARAVTGHPIPAIVGDRRPGDPAILIAGSDRIGRELGWEPQYSDLHHIIQSAWDWHRRHPDGYGD